MEMDLRELSQCKDHLSKYGDSRSQDHLIFNLEIPMLLRLHVYMEMSPRCLYVNAS